MRLLAIPLLLTAAWLSMPGNAMAQQSHDEAAARKPLEAYLRGHATGDAAYIRQAFLPTALANLLPPWTTRWPTEETSSGWKMKPSPRRLVASWIT